MPRVPSIVAAAATSRRSLRPLVRDQVTGQSEVGVSGSVGRPDRHELAIGLHDQTASARSRRQQSSVEAGPNAPAGTEARIKAPVGVVTHERKQRPTAWKSFRLPRHDELAVSLRDQGFPKSFDVGDNNKPAGTEAHIDAPIDVETCQERRGSENKSKLDDAKGAD